MKRRFIRPDDRLDDDAAVVGAFLLAGNAAATAVVRVESVDEDGQVHFVILPGPIARNRHLLRQTAGPARG